MQQHALLSSVICLFGTSFGICTTDRLGFRLFTAHWHHSFCATESSAITLCYRRIERVHYSHVVFLCRILEEQFAKADELEKLKEQQAQDLVAERERRENLEKNLQVTRKSLTQNWEGFLGTAGFRQLKG